ncbi:Endonuclease/exonuclease/phosphatase family protein [Trifolium repens]|nr:Endonuclease/exonuclease/phosphatase family protein [Trifolium repens]
MDDRIEDDEKESLAGLSSVPPHRKAHSYSQQLRGASTHKRHHEVRKHSLDDSRISNNIIESFYEESDSDDDLFPHSNPSAVDEYMEGGGISDDLSQYQPLQEFIGSGGGAGVFKALIRAVVHPDRPTCLELEGETRTLPLFMNLLIPLLHYV